jgi:predicted dehydrogenase
MDWIGQIATVVWAWLGTVNWANASIVFATLGGPVLAVQAQKWLERKRSVDDRRHAIFRTLMATRAAMLSGEHVQAFNAVPVEFYGSKGKLKKINTAWKTYLDHHAEDNPPDDEWVKKRLNLFYDLLFLISQFLGFNFTREQLQRDFYGPRAHGDLETEQTIIRRGLVRLFAGDATLPMAVKEFPVDEQTLLNQATLQKLLQEWLEGQRAVKVQNEKGDAG